MDGRYFLPLMLLMMVVMMFFMSRGAKKQQRAMAEQRQEAIKVGNWVLTRAGMYGQIVEIDGEVLVLASAAGDESIWHSSAILRSEQPPFSLIEEDDNPESAEMEDSLETESADESLPSTSEPRAEDQE